MGVAQGYSKIATSGSVLIYDTGDTINSYLGEPTTNVVNTNGQNFNPLDLYTWVTNGATSFWSRDTTIAKSPVGGIPVKEVSVGTDSYSSTYNTAPYTLGAASQGQTWTVSVYVLAAVGTNLQIWLFGANSAGNYIEAYYASFAATGVWQRISYTGVVEAATTVGVQSRIATATNGATIWWDGLQMELKPHATPFTATARSVTQGLLDLTGQGTLNLANVSYDSNAQIVFDGASNTIRTPSNSSNNVSGDITMELVLKRSAATAATPIHKELQYTTYIAADGAISYADSSFWSYSAFGFHGNVTTGTYHHLVATKSGSLVTIYLDGSVVISQTFGGAITQTSNALYIGSYASSLYYFNGYIPVSKVHNRALTANELLQNYNHYKTRFNLP